MLNYYGETHIGKVRKANEDFFINEKIEDDEHLFIVADGMGGHQAGDVASSLGAQTFTDHYAGLRKNKKTISNALTLSLHKANAKILATAQQEQEKKGMGTTFSALVIKKNRAYIIHVGDSRIYLIRDNDILRLTKDHTFVEKMVEEGRITEEDARNHPQKNILYMSLGARESFFPQLVENFELKEKDCILMCSDGLNSMVDDQIIKEYVLSYIPQQAVDELITLSNKNGGTDNITIQVIHYGDVVPKDNTEPLKVVKSPNNKWIPRLIFAFIIILIIVIGSLQLFGDIG